MTKRLATASMVMALSLTAPIGIAAPACGADLDVCVRALVLENAGFIAACAAAFPAAKPIFEKAFKGWQVLKLPVPGLTETLREGSPARVNATFDANEALRTKSPEDKSNECSARLAMLTQPTPTLAGNAWSLPPDALKKYPR